MTAPLTRGALDAPAPDKLEFDEEITNDSDKHKKSPLYSQALYELAHTLIQEVEDEKAEKVLGKLIRNPKDSLYYYKALNEMGMLHANRKEFDAALEYYKKVVEKSPLTEEGQSALAGIENIYQSQNKPQEFLSYLDKVGLSSIKSQDEKETMLFNSAEQIFLSGNYTAALAALNSFINSYPNGNKAAHANFYIAECYNSEDIDTNTLENAVYWYEYALEQGCELCYYHLGICYEFGRGTDENIKKAVDIHIHRN